MTNLMIYSAIFAFGFSLSCAYWWLYFQHQRYNRRPSDNLFVTTYRMGNLYPNPPAILANVPKRAWAQLDSYYACWHVYIRPIAFGFPRPRSYIVGSSGPWKRPMMVAQNTR